MLSAPRCRAARRRRPTTTTLACHNITRRVCVVACWSLSMLTATDGQCFPMLLLLLLVVVVRRASCSNAEY